MSSFSTGQWPVPRAAYVHVPFCRHRCGYCNFSVVAGRDDLFDRYLAAVSRELESLKRPTLDTLFIGGGTPTHFDVERLQQFLLLVLVVKMVQMILHLVVLLFVLVVVMHLVLLLVVQVLLNFVVLL